MGSSIALEAIDTFRDTNKIDNFEEVVKGACCSLFAGKWNDLPKSMKCV